MKKMVDIPTECPCCGGKVELDAKGINLWCKNPKCLAQLQRQILHWINTLEIMGVGTGTVEGLCEKGFVKALPDLYFLTMEQVQEVTGGSSAAEKVMMAILEKNQIPLAVFLDGLGIDGLGTTTSKLVAKEYKSIGDIMAAVGTSPTVMIVELTNLEGIGNKTASNIVNGLSAMAEVVKGLLSTIEVDEVKAAVGALAGSSFLITGTLSAPRKDVERKIEAAGGVMVSSVSKRLMYLVVGDAPGSKLEKAKTLGVRVISEAELVRMIG